MTAKCAPRSDGPGRNHDTDRNNHDDRSDHNNHCQPGGVVSSTTIVTSAIAITASIAADAVGTDTYAAAMVDITIVQRGLISYTSGSASAIAAAASADGSMQYAATSILLDVAGADLLSYSAEEQYASGTIDSQASSLSFLAIDTSWLNAATTVGQETSRLATSSGSLSGNVAEFAAHLEAVGDNGFTDLAADSFAIEDQLSSSYISASAGVATETVFQTMTGTRFADTVTTTMADTIVRTDNGKDVITAGDGNDWIFSGAGKDRVDAGAGNDTVFAGDSDDTVNGGLGDDWLFGGRGADNLNGGAGDDLLLGGDGKDVLDGGAGNDLIDGGAGDDTLYGGAGNDLFRLGADRGDGDDTYNGGAGADLYMITGNFNDDVVRDFRLAEGDRLLMLNGDWESITSLRAHNGYDITLERGSDADDLVITFEIGRYSATLTLDEFFVLNTGYGAAPRRGEFSDAQALTLLQNLFGDDSGVHANAPTELFVIADAIGDLG